MQRVDISNFKNKRIALVLSGGVVKAAAWHLGVALALEEIGFSFRSQSSPETPDIEISTYVGSSAGSLINLYLASGFLPKHIVEAYISKTSDNGIKPITYKDMLSLKTPMRKPPRTKIFDPFDGLPIFLKQLLKPMLNFSGLFTTNGLYKYVQENVISVDDFEELNADMFVVATQLDHSKKVIFSKYNYPNPRHDATSVYYTGIPISKAVAASMSVPPFYSPFPIENPVTSATDYYIDGEIRETLSTHVAIDNKCDFIISSWTHTPYHYHDEIGSLINYGMPAICMQSIFLLIQKKIVASRARRHTAKDIVDTINDYMQANKFPNTHRKKILSILERKLDYQSGVQLIDIFPKHEDYNMFFRNSFSLNTKKTADLVNSGYSRTKEIFKKREWEN